MPRFSERMHIIQELESIALFYELFKDSDEENESSEEDEEDNFGIIDFSSPAELLAVISTTRYLKHRLPVPKSRNWLEDVLPFLDDNRFRQQMRVSRTTFEFILHTIQSHPIFSNNSIMNNYLSSTNYTLFYGV